MYFVARILLNRQGKLSPDVTAQFKMLFKDYIRMQRDLEKILSQLLRAIGKR